MERQHIVIDQNVFRREELLRPAISQAQANNELIVIPDIAFAEMMKTPQWEYTTKRSLAILSETPTIVGCAKPVGELLREELATGFPCTRILDAELTNAVQGFLAELVRGDDTTLAAIRERIAQAQALAATQHFDAVQARNNLRGVVETLLDVLAPDAKRLLRNGDEATVRTFLSSNDMVDICKMALQGADYPEDVAARLARSESAAVHDLLVHYAIAIRWMNNVNQTRDSILINDLADGDFIVTATFCRALISVERNVQLQFERIMSVIESRRQLLATPTVP